LVETKEQKRARKARERGETTPIVEVPAVSVPVSDTNKVTVLCVRYGNKYGRDYVERLRNMVARNMTIPYEFVCLTDDTNSIEGVRSIVQPGAGYAKLWWQKVHMFDSALPIQGKIIFFDLDVVIHANIDKLLAFADRNFVGIHDFNRAFHSTWMNLNSSVMAWTHGTQSHVWEQFKANPRDAQRLHGDQDWIWKTSKHIIKFWPKEWVQSYKWEIRKREELTMSSGKRQFKQVDHTVEVSPACCVTVFHGDPKPQDVQDKFVVDNWR
jgi:hypothetical protein